MEQVTAGFVYIRLHGPGEIYASDYHDRDLGRWGQRIEAWRAGGEPDEPERDLEPEPSAKKKTDVYVYFDNTAPVMLREMRCV